MPRCAVSVWVHHWHCTDLYSFRGTRTHAQDPSACRLESFIRTSPNHTHRLQTWCQGKSLESWQAKLVPLDRSWLPLSEIPEHQPKKKKTVRAARLGGNWRYRFQAGVWNCQILNRIVESQLFTFFVKRTPPMALWHRAQSDKCFTSFLFQVNLVVSLLESESGL
jgi:hypothetical protein